MTSGPNVPTDKETQAEERKAQAETRAQSGREAMAEYRDREAAADDNASRLKGLRLARDAEAAAQGAEELASAPPARQGPGKTKPQAK